MLLLVQRPGFSSYLRRSSSEDAVAASASVRRSVNVVREVKAVSVGTQTNLDGPAIDELVIRGEHNGFSLAFKFYFAKALMFMLYELLSILRGKHSFLVHV
jgi:hypothetical protein